MFSGTSIDLQCISSGIPEPEVRNLNYFEQKAVKKLDNVLKPIHIKQGATPQTKNGIFWEFLPNVGPPPPPSPLLGPFLVFTKMFTFWSLSSQLLLGISDPNPLKKQIPKTSRFRRVFPEFPGFKSRVKLIKYHLPTIVKHILAPKNDFGIPKITSQKILFLGGCCPQITQIMGTCHRVRAGEGVASGPIFARKFDFFNNNHKTPP